MSITFKSTVIFVRDIQRSRQFYEDLLGQQVEMDFGVNVGYVGGFAIWQVEHANQTIYGQPRTVPDQMGQENLELYFESEKLDSVWKRISAGSRIAHPIMEQPWGQRVFRVYDPDGHLVEVAEPMPFTIKRMLNQGMTPDAVARRTAIPLAGVLAMAGETEPAH